MKIDFSKSQDGLVPAVVQDAKTLKVLMLGYMNEEAVKVTKETGKVTFYSRSKKRLWTKGESSSNFLHLVSMDVDCDNDALLVKANPDGPTCHTGEDTCWSEPNTASAGQFIDYLESVIKDRKDNPKEGSYTNMILDKGINKVAQKVGEEAVELVIEAKDNDKNLFLGEAADLMYHYLMLIQAKDYSLEEVVKVLRERHQ